MWDVPVSWVLVDKDIRVRSFQVHCRLSLIPRIANYHKIMSANTIIFPVAVLFSKISILLLYLRLFKIDRRLRLNIYVGLFVMALFHTAMTGIGIGTVVKCVGLSASTSPFCNDASGSIQLSQSAFNIMTDFWILLLPMPLLKKLQLPQARKIGLYFVFGAGLL